MTRNEKIEYVARQLSKEQGAWKGVDDKTLDILVTAVETYLKTDRVSELDLIITKAQAEKTAITEG